MSFGVCDTIKTELESDLDEEEKFLISEGELLTVSNVGPHSCTEDGKTEILPIVNDDDIKKTPSKALKEKEERGSTACEFRCPHCLKVLTSIGQFKDHSATPTGEKWYKCKVCKKAFNLQRYLKGDMTIHVNPDKKSKYEICKKVFSRPPTLKVHMKSHTNEECKKEFSTPSNLSSHLNVHTGETQYKCVICKEVFHHFQTFKIHVGAHMGEWLFKCEICNKRFRHRWYFSNHMKSHEDGDNTKLQKKWYNCSNCSRTFSSQLTLQKHFLIHSDEKLYMCQCKASFARKDFFQHIMKCQKTGKDVEGVRGDKLATLRSESTTVVLDEAIEIDRIERDEDINMEPDRNRPYIDVET